jgi:hypothetical protein
MQDRHSTPGEEVLSRNSETSGGNSGPEPIQVLNLLVRPHGLEPGKALTADAEQRLLAPPSVTDLLYDMKAAKRWSDHLEKLTLAYLGMTALSIWWFLVCNVKEEDRRFCGALIIFALCLATINTVVRFINVGSAQAAIARLMAGYHDLRVVGPLADALRMPDMETQYLAAMALRHLLPRLTADDGDLLNEAQRNSLYRHLRGRNVELSLAILRALEQVGDARAVPHVQRLTEAGVPCDGRVRKAAEECLPYLLLRVERAAAPRILLRASSNSDRNPEALLRTVAGPIDTDANLLLRAPD